MNLEQWAIDWRIPMDALLDLRRRTLNEAPASHLAAGAPAHTEAWAQSAVRLEASRKGVKLWRNNVGADFLQDGSFIRWGLANESKPMNKVLKSGDLIGLRPIMVTPAMLGRTIGQFVSREIKAPGWRYGASDREVAQRAWADLINALGGDAAFASGEGTL